MRDRAVDHGTEPTSIRWRADGVTVEFADGEVAELNRFWLRDNCPSLGDRASLVRPCSVADLPDDLAIIGARATPDGSGVIVEFSDGLVDEFPRDLLVSARPDEASGPMWRQWDGHAQPVRVDLADLEPGNSAHHALLEAVARDGFALVTGLEAADTVRLAALLGPIRETDFGTVFDIVTEPDPFTPSQSESALDPHTDDPYRYTPPGVSILHCVTPCDGEGGASTIVDGFAVAAAIAERDPAAFALLSTVPVPYVHRRDRTVAQGADVHLRAEAPVIAVDRHGDVCGIRFHERSMAPLRLPPPEVEPFYRALMAFARAVLGDEFAFRRRLETGEAIVYDNQRVLHGRTEITGGTSRRHLRLCTVDRDQMHSRLRRLREVHRPGTESDPLPAGNLA